MSTAPDLLDRHHGPPHRICLTGALVHHSVGPSLTPSSAPSLALHTSPRSLQHIRLTESTVQRARRSLRPLHRTRSTDAILIRLHRPCFTDAAASSGYFDLYSFGFSLYRATVHLPQMSFLVCRQPAQTQPQHEHHRRSLAIKYDNNTHTPPRIGYYYPTADAYVHFSSISSAPLNFFRTSFNFS